MANDLMCETRVKNKDVSKVGAGFTHVKRGSERKNAPH